MTIDNAITKTRMTPQERIDDILSHTAEMVLSEGLSAISLDKVRQRANISRSLIYNYFKDTNELLTALLKKERKAYRERQEGVIARAHNYEEMVRLTIRTTLQYYAVNGELITTLTKEPIIANAVLHTEEERAWQTQVHSYAAKQLMERYHIPEEVAVVAFTVLQGIAESAGQRLITQYAGDGFDFIEEIIYVANIASIRAIGRKYAKANTTQPIDEDLLDEAKSIIESLSAAVNG